MLGWLRGLFNRDATTASSHVQPLSFDYTSKEGFTGRVSLHSWVSDGIYVVGDSLTHNRRMTYRLDRITRFHDLSYQQIAGYRPPVGSRLDPKRLP